MKETISVILMHNSKFFHIELVKRVVTEKNGFRQVQYQGRKRGIGDDNSLIVSSSNANRDLYRYLLSKRIAAQEREFKAALHAGLASTLVEMYAHALRHGLSPESPKALEAYTQEV